MNQDHFLINQIINNGQCFNKQLQAQERIPEYPLDEDIINNYLSKILLLLREGDEEYEIFNQIDLIKRLWQKVIEKSIKCLRHFDQREPFQSIPNKHPIAYGVTELSEYFDKYSAFESMLYGSGKYYRDHVIHVIRVWLLGLNCLLKENFEFLEKIEIGNGFKIKKLEKLSIWSIIALTHDLGYPLEKAQSIIDKTKDMMKSFIANPAISMDLSFNGVQNNMNDFVVRFISSKMHPTETEHEEADQNESKTEHEETGQNKFYKARLQPKYYFKFQKSLEKSQHGILSAIIIYKLLLYFLESDYNINEDYTFDEEEARQFYIRREILRSMSAHTCKDIYHLEMLSFAFLLIIVDDVQEWGRKRLSELYVKSNIQSVSSGISFDFETKGKNIDGKEIYICNINEDFCLHGTDKELYASILVQSLASQYDRYNEIFRDGQDTGRRNFTLNKYSKFSDENFNYVINYVILYDKESEFTIEISKRDGGKINTNVIPKFLSNDIGAHSLTTEARNDNKSYIFTIE